MHPVPHCRTQTLKRGKSLARDDAVAMNLIRRMGNQLGQAEICKLAYAAASHDRSTGDCDDGDAHPEGIQAGRMTIVGKRIKADINVMIKRHVLLQRLFAEERNPILGDALLSQKSKRALTARALGGKQDEPRPINGLQNACPES